TGELGGVRVQQRFDGKDGVRRKSGGRPFARVGAVRPDGKLEVWILKMRGTQQHWKGPRVIDTSDVTNNYGPLDDVGIGSKLFELTLVDQDTHGLKKRTYKTTGMLTNHTSL